MALLIVSLSEIAERPHKNKSIIQSSSSSPSCSTSSPSSIYRNPLFDPLQPSEEPNLLDAGSNQALYHPMAHFWEYFKRSAILPWPFGRYPVGFRHALSPPVDPKSSGRSNLRLSLWDKATRSTTVATEEDDDDDDDAIAVVARPTTNLSRDVSKTRQQTDEDTLSECTIVFGDDGSDIDQPV